MNQATLSKVKIIVIIIIFFNLGLFGESFQILKCDLFSPQHNSDMCLSKYIYFCISEYFDIGYNRAFKKVAGLSVLQFNLTLKALTSRS